MAPRRRSTVLAVAAAALALGVGSQLPLDRWLRRVPPLGRSPALVADGARVLAKRCLHCHGDIPLRPRVAGWSLARAYDAIGRLPELNAGMPRFPGTDDERRALAAYLTALGDPEGPGVP